MRVLLSGGGTAGHIYPALTVADRLREDGHEVGFIGTRRGPESRLAADAGVRFHPLPARGFDRSRPLSLIVALAVLAVSVIRACVFLLGERADVVVGFGGYVSLPVGLAAILTRTPLVLHEQNSVPGMANRVLASRAEVVAVTYEESVARMRRPRRTVRTGNPVREAILTADRSRGREVFGLPAEATVLLVFGGSRGARHINEAMEAIAPDLMERADLHVLHVAGRDEAEAVRARLDGSLGRSALADRYHVLDYVEEMGSALAAADLLVARAGATSIAEITAIGRAAVLIPYPFATEDHQTLNARDVEAAGAAVVVADADLDHGGLLPVLEGLLDDPDARDRMARASAQLGVPDATHRLATLITQTGVRRDTNGDLT